MSKTNLSKVRKKIAKEAAFLLYSSQEKEYKQAKKKAAKTFGANILPNNLEVAVELNKIAEETEGLARQIRLRQMRYEALKIMETLEHYHPKLIGSVWRGTIHKNSDIDIIAYSDEIKDVYTKLEECNFNIIKAEWASTTKHGRKETSYHIKILLPLNNEVDISVRNLDKLNIQEKCEIYGDFKKGLTYFQLEKIIKKDPLKKFLPI